jgi:predicted nucleic acid-binding protein
MKVVVADTSPINYLVLIDCIDVLRRLYARVVIPEEVLNELTADGGPRQVSAWIRTRPEWVEVRPAAATTRLPLQIGEDELDAGEIAAISVALGESNRLLLIDESAGRMVASRLGVANTGTLGVLLAAAREGMLDFGEALDKLRRTNFRISQTLIDKLLAEDRTKDAT